MWPRPAGTRETHLAVTPQWGTEGQAWAVFALPLGTGRKRALLQLSVAALPWHSVPNDSSAGRLCLLGASKSQSRG